MGIKRVIIFICTIFVLGISNSESLNTKNYYYFEEDVIKKTEFAKNAVKIQYETDLSIEDEYKRVCDIFKKDYKIETSDKLKLEGRYSLEFSAWREGNKTFVEGVISNKDTKTNSRNLKKELKKIQDDKIQNINYFNYYKGKIKVKNNNIDKLDMSFLNLKGEFIKIQNGYTGKLTLGDGSRLNYSIMSYDTGIYLIIGTPIIFKTY